MRNLLAAFCIQLLSFVPATGQQNHVPNGSFEGYTNCPVAAGQITQCVGWTSWNSGSPDYYNSCHTGTSAGVPVNWPGYQSAASGNAYVGLVDIWSNGVHREYVYSQITPLQTGAVYEVSLLVSLSNKCQFGSNGLCVYFFDNGPSYYGNTQAIPAVTPQISFAGYGAITDTANWVRLSGTFVADSAYDNIVIGGFLSPSQAVMDTFNSSAQYPNSYYYIDSVVVKPLDTFHADVADSLLCAGDTVSVQYFTYQKYNSNNVFTAQLSNAAGSFSSPINIGTKLSDTAGVITCVIPGNISQGTGYRIRAIASSPADTTNNISKTMKIGNPDSTNISVSNNSPICEGNTLLFAANTFVPGTVYSWTGPNGFNSASWNPYIAGATPTQNGDYRVMMKWYGCEVTDTTQATVKPTPAKPVANNNSPICAGDTLDLGSSSSTSGVSYSWAGPGGFSSVAQDTSVANSTIAMSGDYIVTATLNGCNRKDTTTVLVKPMPAAVSLSNNGPLCAGDTLHLLSTASTTGVSYSWTGPGSYTANTQNTYRAGSTAGMTGWYKMTVDLNGCMYKDSTNATVHPIPAMPSISYSNPLCIGETLSLGTGAVTGAVYSWIGPNSFSSSSQNPSRGNMQFGDTGRYKLAVSLNGCVSDTAQATIHLNALPFVVIFPTPGDSICQGDPVNFTALPNNHGGTPAYQWYVNGQLKGTGAGFSSSTLNDQDVVRCDMTENTKCSAAYTDASNDVTMNVLPWLAPSVTITANPSRPLKDKEYVVFTATVTNGGNNPKFQWKRNGQDVVGATGNIWSANTLNDNDSISVEIISDYKCPQPANAKSNGIKVKVLTGVAGINELGGLVLYPNPNNGRFVLQGKLDIKEIINLEVVNSVGQTIFEGDAEPQNGTLHKEITLPNMPAGLYMLRIKADKGTAVIKIEIR